MGFFDWLFGKSKERLELEEKQRLERWRQQLQKEDEERRKKLEQQQKAEAKLKREQEAEQRAKKEAEAQREREKEQQRQAQLQAELKAKAREAEEKRQQAERERLEAESRIASLRQQQEEVQRSLCETDTVYCSDLKRLYERNPKNFKFTTIRSLTSNCGVWHELENGVKQLETYEQLNQYIFSYGLMHQAKLQQAFHSVFADNHLQLTGQSIEIIDYGCGQGIGTICLIDYIKEQTNRQCNISKVKLIEPSVLALKRAVLNARYSLKSFDQPENVHSINKELDDINLQDVGSQVNTVKIHVFSNIIDVEDFDLYQLCNKIQATQKGVNIFVCVSPNIMESRNRRLDNFQQYFSEHGSFAPIANRDSDILNPSNLERPWKRYERVFWVNFGEAIPLTTPVISTRLGRSIENDDLPF